MCQHDNIGKQIWGFLVIALRQNEDSTQKKATSLDALCCAIILEDACGDFFPVAVLILEAWELKSTYFFVHLVFYRQKN